MGNRGEFRAVYGSIWTGETGRQIKAAGKDAQILALYLVTCKHSTMVGLYLLPWAYAAHDTGLSLEEIGAARQVLEQLGFAVYDDASEWVWVVNGYFHQCADTEGKLPSKAGDKRLVGALALFRQAPSKLQTLFAERYGSPFEAPSKPLPGGIEAPSGTVPKPVPVPEPNHTQTGAGTPARVCAPSAAAGNGPDHPTDAAGDAWEDWRVAWGQNKRRRQLPLTPINGDLPKLAEIAKRYPDQAHRRGLMAAYFTSAHKPLLEKPYSLGMFLYWASWLDENAAPPAPAAAEPTIWDRVLERVATKVNQHTLYSWFKPLHFIRREGQTLILRAPNPHLKSWLERNERAHLAEALAEVEPGLTVTIELEDAA